MTLIEIFTIIFIHWVADFVFQTDKMAQGKSKNWSDLFDHTLTYSIIVYIGIIGLFIFNNGWEALFTSEGAFNSIVGLRLLGFWLITIIAHTITDYFTSRLNSKLWAKGDVHNFFVSVGFDQVLHYIQLFLTYYLLIKIK